MGLGREWGVEFTYSEVSCLGTYLSEVTCAKYKHIAKYIEIYRNYMKSKESICIKGKCEEKGARGPSGPGPPFLRNGP